MDVVQSLFFSMLWTAEKLGGLIIQWPNEVRDALGDLASIAFRDVIREPIVRDADPVRGLPALVAS